jgi:hypothetical protein
MNHNGELLKGEQAIQAGHIFGNILKKHVVLFFQSRGCNAEDGEIIGGTMLKMERLLERAMMKIERLLDAQ